MRDLYFGLMVLRYFDVPAVTHRKHGNACGFARQVMDESPEFLFRASRDYDFRSQFGGVIAADFSIDRPTAECLIQTFNEVIVAPEYEEG